MSIVNMIKNIKELFPDYIVFVKIGNFYDVYFNDSCIISYLFNYKIKGNNIDELSCGFPLNSINKIKYILENKNINYIIIDKKHNYEELEKMNYKKKNKYNELLDQSIEYVDKLNRINKIKDYLIKDSVKLEEIEKILYG